MPKKRSIRTSSPSDFEPKRKNPISLGSDSNMDNDLKPLKIGGETTPLKISKDTIEIGSTFLYNGSNVLSGSIEGTELISTGETGGTKFLREDGDGTCSWQTVSGGGGASALNDLSDVTYSSGDLTITSLDKIISGALTFDSSGDITLSADGGNVFMDDGTSPIFKFDLDNVAMYMFDDADAGGQFGIAVGANGATTLSTVDDDAANADLTFTIDGSINFDVEGTVEFDGCGVGFDLVTPTYNASDTNVDFLTGNKQFVTFGSGNITDLNLIFPKTSGNFTLILKQDGSGSRTVTNYKVWDRNDSAAASGSATVKFAGGSNPTLTTAASKTDIISFFYDADNEIAYGVASLNF